MTNERHIKQSYLNGRWFAWHTWNLGTWLPPQYALGAVSFRFSQGLLTLMCKNSTLKADVNFLIFLSIKSITGCKLLWLNTLGPCYSVLGQNSRFSQFPIQLRNFTTYFIFRDNDKYIAYPQTDFRVCKLEPYVWKYFIFCIKYKTFSVFHFLIT